VYKVYLLTQGRGKGGELNQREGERSNTEKYRSQSWVENSNMTECKQEIGYLLSKNYVKHLPHNPLTGHFLYMTTFSIVFYDTYFSTNTGNSWNWKSLRKTL
jgi:hypothetical protein